METVIISITESCNLNCPGCYRDKPGTVMAFDDYKTIINKLPPSEIKTITLSGGEPFLHPDLEKIVKYTAKKILKPRIVTSGVIRFPLKKIAPYIELITVTIKYPEPKIDDLWKGLPKAHKKALRFINAAKKANIPLNFNWIADSQNYRYLLKMQRFAQEHEAMLQLVRYIPFSKDSLIYHLKYYIWDALCKEATKYDNIHIAFPSAYSYQDCPAGINRMSITASGNVSGCIYATSNEDFVGNILSEPYHIIAQKLEAWRLNYMGTKGCIPFIKLCKKWQAEGWRFDQ